MIKFSLRIAFLEKLQTCRCFCPLLCCIWEHGRNFASSHLFFLLDISSRIVYFISLRKENTSCCENSGFHDDHCKFQLTLESRNCSKHFIMYEPQSVLFGCGGTAGYLGRLSFTSSIRVEILGVNIQCCSFSKRKMGKTENVLLSIGKLKRKRKNALINLIAYGMYHFIFQPEFQGFPCKC